MIHITLIISGKSKTYKAAGVNLSNSIEAYDLYREYTEANGNYPSELLDRCCEFVTKIFGNAFTVQELGNGYKGSAFTLLPNLFSAVIGYVEEQVINFPEPPTTAERAAAATAS